MAHSRQRRFRAHKGVKNQIWTVLLLDSSSIAAATILDLSIVEASDWAFVDGQRATVMAIRGYISVSFSNSVAASAEGNVMGLIAVVDDAAAAPPLPDFAASYVDSHILDTFGWAIPEVAANVHRGERQHLVNVKTKRIIRARDDVRLVIKNNSVNTVEVTSVIRALVRKND